MSYPTALGRSIVQSSDFGDSTSALNARFPTGIGKQTGTLVYKDNGLTLELVLSQGSSPVDSWTPLGVALAAEVGTAEFNAVLAGITNVQDALNILDTLAHSNLNSNNLADARHTFTPEQTAVEEDLQDTVQDLYSRATITVSETEPINPVVDDCWIDIS